MITWFFNNPFILFSDLVNLLWVSSFSLKNKTHANYIRIKNNYIKVNKIIKVWFKHPEDYKNLKGSCHGQQTFYIWKSSFCWVQRLTIFCYPNRSPPLFVNACALPRNFSGFSFIKSQPKASLTQVPFRVDVWSSIADFNW